MRRKNFFWSVTLPFMVILFLICNVALVDMLGTNYGLSVAAVSASLIGGVGGPVTAFLIANKQIKQQESMQIIDLKLQKFQEIISSVSEIRQGFYNYRRIVSVYFEQNKSSNCADFYDNNKEKIQKIHEENTKHRNDIYKNMVYMKHLGLDEYEVNVYLRYVDDIYVYEKHFEKLEVEALLHHSKHLMFLNDGYFEMFQEIFEKEIENILANK